MAITWFHSYDFPDGERVTGYKSLDILKQEADVLFDLPLKDKTLLDIGAWDGYFTFEAEKRGAIVHATDYFCWDGPGWGTKAGFDYAHGKFHSNAKSTVVDVPNLDPNILGLFDIVLFSGVLYHLKDPFFGLEKAAALASETLIVETVCMLNEIKEPIMKFLPGASHNNDPTNFWAPNAACLEMMLRELGFKNMSFRPSENFFSHPTPRLVVHAKR